jgi:hypothetical protein
MALLMQEICYNTSDNTFSWHMYFTKVLKINVPCSTEYITHKHQQSSLYQLQHEGAATSHSSTHN